MNTCSTETCNIQQPLGAFSFHMLPKRTLASSPREPISVKRLWKKSRFPEFALALSSPFDLVHCKSFCTVPGPCKLCTFVRRGNGKHNETAILAKETISFSKKKKLERSRSSELIDPTDSDIPEQNRIEVLLRTRFDSTLRGTFLRRRRRRPSVRSPRSRKSCTASLPLGNNIRIDCL